MIRREVHLWLTCFSLLRVFLFSYLAIMSNLKWFYIAMKKEFFTLTRSLAHFREFFCVAHKVIFPILQGNVCKRGERRKWDFAITSRHRREIFLFARLTRGRKKKKLSRCCKDEVMKRVNQTGNENIELIQSNFWRNFLRENPELNFGRDEGKIEPNW